MLVEHFLRKAAARFKTASRRRSPTPVDPRAPSRTTARPTCASSAISPSAARIGLTPAGPAQSEPAKAATLAEQMDRHERGLIRDELIMAGGDVRVAPVGARDTPKTLYDKIRRHGLEPERLSLRLKCSTSARRHESRGLEEV